MLNKPDQAYFLTWFILQRMRVIKTIILISLPILLINSSLAENYFRCRDNNGSIVFSQAPCGPDAIEGKLPTHSESINLKKTPRRNAVQQLENYRNSLKQIDRITGSSSSPKTPARETGSCENVSRMQLRNARVSKDIKKCHSEEDIRHIYGAPDAISTWSDRSGYDTRWRYNDDNEGKIYVYFKNGLVTKWSTHQK